MNVRGYLKQNSSHHSRMTGDHDNITEALAITSSQYGTCRGDLANQRAGMTANGKQNYSAYIFQFLTLSHEQLQTLSTDIVVAPNPGTENVSTL